MVMVGKICRMTMTIRIRTSTSVILDKQRGEQDDEQDDDFDLEDMSDSSDTSDIGERSPLFQILLSHVCRRWRDVALNLGIL